MHPTEYRGRLQLSGGWEDDGSHNSMVREVGSVLHAIACFVTHLVGRRIYTLAHQRMGIFDSTPGSLRMYRVLLYPVTLALEGISGQRYPPP
jgi:hypothetical protein